MPFKITLVLLVILSASLLSAAEELAFVPEMTPKFLEQMQDCKERSIPVIDYHIHLRGGMTAEKAAVRQEKTGIGSGVLENAGRDWKLSDNEKLRAFIDEAEKARANGEPLLIGIQVNDRDWFKVIDPKLRERLDFVLADTMIMGTGADGKPQKLWLDNYKIDDPDEWMRRYMDHNRQVLSEPITILANPTYLPQPIEHLYDRLWTEERMREIIAKAIEKNVAIEIQAGTKFPSMRFLKLAKEMGAKFSLGTNNHNDKPSDIDRWYETIKELQLDKDDFLVLKKHPR